MCVVAMRPLARVLMGDAASGLIRIADRRSCGTERLSSACDQAARIHWQAVQNGTSRGLNDRARRRAKVGVERIASGKVLAFRLKLKARSSSGLVCTDRLADNVAYRLQGSTNEPITEWYGHVRQGNHRPDLTNGTSPLSFPGSYSRTLFKED